MTTAFDPVQLGRYTLRNRIAMAPMTRSRAYGPGATATPLMATYYAQRASAGLIITEGIQPSAVGQGYSATPGLHSQAQVEAWRPVTEAVHAEGGVIFAQLMHTGRIGHPDLYADGLALTPVSASAVAAAGSAYTPSGPQDHVVPLQLDAAGVEATIAEFAHAAANAIEAGFDGVELHGANGYLLHQFLSTNANVREDEWGGEDRIRFVVDVVLAVAAAIGADRLGLRISPANPFNDIVEDGHRDTYRRLLSALDPVGLAYLHIGEGPDPEFTAELRARWSGRLILNPYTPGGFTGPAALGLVESGAADLVSYAALFLSNPDLPERLRLGAPLIAPDYSLAYGGDEHGYTDYPTLDA